MYLDPWIEDEKDSAEVKYWKGALRRLYVVFIVSSLAYLGIIGILAAHILAFTGVSQ